MYQRRNIRGVSCIMVSLFIMGHWLVRSQTLVPEVMLTAEQLVQKFQQTTSS